MRPEQVTNARPAGETIRSGLYGDISYMDWCMYEAERLTDTPAWVVCTVEPMGEGQVAVWGRPRHREAPV